MSKWRISKRFLFTYLSFFICLILLFIPLYTLVSSLFIKSYLNTSMHVIETGIRNIENDLMSINTAMQDAYINPDIKRIAYIQQPLSMEDYYKTTVAVTDFRRYIIQNGMITDCGLIFPNNMVLTPQRIHYTGDEFYNSYFCDGSAKDFGVWKQSLLENSNISKFCSLQKISSWENRTYEALTLVIKLPLASSVHTSLFFATIDKNALLSCFATQEMLDYGTLYIHDKNGVLLLSHEKSTDSELRYVEKESEKTGLHISVGIKNTFFAQKLQPLRTIAAVFCALYILAGLLLSCFFAYGTARPIQHIVDAAVSISSNRFHLPQPDKISSEFKYILNFLNKADHIFENYEQTLTQQEELLRSNLFERLIRGIDYSSSTFDRARIYFPDFPEQYHIANLLLPELNTCGLSTYAARQTLLLSIIKPKLPPGARIHFTSNLLVLLIPAGTTGHDKQDIEKLLSGIKDDLYKEVGVRSRITISDVFFKIEDMHVAFYQTDHLLRLIGRAPGDQIYRKEDYPLSNLFLTLGFWESNHFFGLIVRAEREQALHMLHGTLRKMKEIGYISENEIQQIFYSYRQIFIHLKDELPEKYSSQLPLPVYDNRADIDSLFNSIADCIHTACDCVNRKKADEKEIFEQSILNYISDNLYNNDLYIKSVTDHFGISESTLQGIMHKLTAASFFDYVEKKRMEKAALLLKYTSDPVSKLAEQCGYSTLNSFYKAFKRNFGLSPSVMRKNQTI